MTSKIKILAEDGSVENYIIADENFAEEFYPGRWEVVLPEPVPEPEPVPLTAELPGETDV